MHHALCFTCPTSRCLLLCVLSWQVITVSNLHCLHPFQKMPSSSSGGIALMCIANFQGWTSGCVSSCSAACIPGIVALPAQHCQAMAVANAYQKAKMDMLSGGEVRSMSMRDVLPCMCSMTYTSVSDNPVRRWIACTVEALCFVTTTRALRRVLRAIFCDGAVVPFE